jgi:hypothetical protein
MHRRIMAAAIAFAALIAPSLAAAQTPSIVGVWSRRVVTAQGAVAVIWDEFDANGQLHVKIVNPTTTASTRC